MVKSKSDVSGSHTEVARNGESAGRGSADPDAFHKELDHERDKAKAGVAQLKGLTSEERSKVVLQYFSHELTASLVDEVVKYGGTAEITRYTSSGEAVNGSIGLDASVRLASGKLKLEAGYDGTSGNCVKYKLEGNKAVAVVNETTAYSQLKENRTAALKAIQEEYKDSWLNWLGLSSEKADALSAAKKFFDEREKELLHPNSKAISPQSGLGQAMSEIL